MTSSNPTSLPEKLSFGPITIPTATQVFVHSELSYGLVNLKPVLPGHVLIIPRRIAPRVADLTPEELSDMWALAALVGGKLEKHFGAQSLTYAVQDGAAAGQTIPHVHVHVIPRRLGDFKNNDEIYDRIDEMSEKQGEREHAVVKGKEDQQAPEKMDLDDEQRKSRTAETMAAEAAELRALFVTSA